MPSTRHRVFLATLIVASKYLNDSTPKNRHWREHAILFDLIEINLMEKQLLLLLEYDLYFDESEACKHFAPFMAAAGTRRQKQQQEVDATMRAAAVDKVSKACKARARAQQEFPPTPPRDAVPPVPALSAPSSASTLGSNVNGLAKRLSTTNLSSGPPPELQSPCSYRAIPPAICSTYSVESTSSSEAGSMIDDSGSSSSSSSEFASASEGEYDDDEERREPLPKKLFLRVIRSPTYRYQIRNRKASDTSSIKSNATVTGQAIIHSPTQQSVADYGVGSRCKERVSSLSFGQSGEEMQRGKILPSSTMSSISSGRQGMSARFLSRMWGAATKSQGQDKEKTSDANHPVGNSKTRPGHAPIVEIVEPGENLGYGAGAFRKIVHSRSVVFCGGDA
jgi:G1/S-specific cyclin PLC1